MKNFYLAVGALAIGALLGIMFSSGIGDVDDAIAFEDIEVTSDEKQLAKVFDGHILLPSISADEDIISDLIGAIVIRTSTGDQYEWTYDYRFRPNRDLIKTKLANEQIFHGIVSAKANFGGHFEILSGEGGAEEVAESTITNQLIIGYKDNADIPFQELSKIRLSPDKEFFFVTRAVVTSITSKRFRRHSGEGKIEGIAFGANGNVYVNRNTQLTQQIISFRPIALSTLQAAEAGVGDEHTALRTKSRREPLSTEEASKLIDHLNSKTKEFAPTTAPLGDPQTALPTQLSAMQQIVWINDFQPRRQSTQRRCWAAVTAMLMGWQKGQVIEERDAVVNLGSHWEKIYDRNTALPKDYKLELLKAAGFEYEAPMSYAPQGLRSLLESYGPIWFTVDKDLGRHATVLTGLFLDPKKNEYWVAYVDPVDGSLKADTYSAYMSRYEAPAFRANEENSGLVETEADLDIQVIHL